MPVQDNSSVELPSSSLTHKELRMLCLDNDLSISGKKSILVERLLDAGLPWEELGLEQKEISEELILEESLDSKELLETTEEELIILEEESQEVEKEDISEEIFEAELIEESDDLVIANTKNIEEVLKNKLTNPKIIFSSIVIGLLVIGSGWYIYSQPESFSPDKLRYGDSMDFSISNGFLQIEGDELVEIIATQLGAEDKMCKSYRRRHY